MSLLRTGTVRVERWWSHMKVKEGGVVLQCPSFPVKRTKVLDRFEVKPLFRYKETPCD